MHKKQAFGIVRYLALFGRVFSILVLFVSLCGCAQGKQGKTAKEKFWSFNDDCYKWLMDIKEEPEPPVDVSAKP